MLNWYYRNMIYFLHVSNHVISIIFFFSNNLKNNFYQFKNTKKYKINHTPISIIKPTSYLYLSLNSLSSSSPKKKKTKTKTKKHINFSPNKLLMFILLMTSPLNLNCLKFSNQSPLSLSLFDLSSPYFMVC